MNEQPVYTKEEAEDTIIELVKTAVLHDKTMIDAFVEKNPWALYWLSDESENAKKFMKKCTSYSDLIVEELPPPSEDLQKKYDKMNLGKHIVFVVYPSLAPEKQRMLFSFSYHEDKDNLTFDSGC